jgi:glutathione S-transferase
MSHPITVYSFRRCPFAMRVRMTLHEKGITFHTQEEQLKQLSPQLLALHPEGKVPVLVHGNRVLYESSIITEYLDETFGAGIALMPESPGSRAEVRLWTYWCNHLFKPDVDRLKYGVSRFSEVECAGIEPKILGHLARLEKALSRSDYLVDGTFSLADIHVFPFVRQLIRITPPPPFLTTFPATLAWADRLSQRPSFQQTMEIPR